MNNRLLAVVVPVAIALVCVAGSVGAETVVIPYGSCGWKYLPNPPSGPGAPYSAVALDDQGWASGCAPFGVSGGCQPPGSPFSGGRLLIRRHIYNPGPPTILWYTLRGRDTFEVAVNGFVDQGGNLLNECPPRSIRGGRLLDTGDNVFLVDFYSGGTLGGDIDVEFVFDSVTGTQAKSWGSVKAIYR